MREKTRTVLYILKDNSSTLPSAVITQNTEILAQQTQVVLMQNAHALNFETQALECYRLENEIDENGSCVYPRISYDALVEMIFAADTVISW